MEQVKEEKIYIKTRNNFIFNLTVRHIGNDIIIEGIVFRDNQYYTSALATIRWNRMFITFNTPMGHKNINYSLNNKPYDDVLKEFIANNFGKITHYNHVYNHVLE